MRGLQPFHTSERVRRCEAHSRAPARRTDASRTPHERVSLPVRGSRFRKPIDSSSACEVPVGETMPLQSVLSPLADLRSEFEMDAISRSALYMRAAAHLPLQTMIL